jgi:hypothetical protein
VPVCAFIELHPATPITPKNSKETRPNVAAPFIREVLSKIKRLINSMMAASVHRRIGLRPCGTTLLKNGDLALVRAVVVSVSVVGAVPAPGATVGGTNPAVVAVGSPVAENVTVPGKFPPTPEALMVYIAAWPAETVLAPEVFDTEKSVMVKFTEFDAPPPGAGFVTTTAGVPGVMTSDARIAAVT